MINYFLQKYRRIKTGHNDSKNELKYGPNQYNADIIISLGNACRPAQYLKNAKLRYVSSPLDWMMEYSLDTVIHLFKTNFIDYFKNILVDEEKTFPEYPHKWVTDVDNKIISIHHFDWDKSLESEKQSFRIIMDKKYHNLDLMMKLSRKIMFISNRENDFEYMKEFMKDMYKIYKKKMVYINVVDTNNLIADEINEINITKKIKYIEIKFNDAHPNGRGFENPDYWLGNTAEWDNLMSKISLTNYSVILLTMGKILKKINEKRAAAKNK